MTAATIRPCRFCDKPVRKTLKNRPKNRKGERCKWFYCDRNCYDQFRRVQVLARQKQCLYCQSLFIPVASQTRKFCSERCWKAAKKATPKNCSYCGVIFTPIKFHSGFGKFISHNAGKTCSDICLRAFYRTNETRRKKISLAFRGEKHPLWKGGCSYLSSASFRGYDWEETAACIRQRDNYACQKCGMTQTEHVKRGWLSLQVHHIVPFHNFSSAKAANKYRNLITLCKSCHRKAEAQVSQVQMTILFAANRSARRNGHRKKI